MVACIVQPPTIVVVLVAAVVLWTPANAAQRRYSVLTGSPAVRLMACFRAIVGLRTQAYSQTIQHARNGGYHTCPEARHNRDMRRAHRSTSFRRRARTPRRLPYKPRRSLLSRGEAAFYFALRVAVRGRFLIAFKVRLADLITCTEQAWEAGFGHMIARQHLDFVLCDWSSTDIVMAIELDDRSHNRRHRRTRDKFLNEALSSAGVPLVRFQAAAKYDATEIAKVLDAAVPCSA